MFDILSIYRHIKICINIQMLKNTPGLLGRQNQYMITGYVNVELKQDMRLT